MMLYNDNLLNVGRHGQQAEDQHVNIEPKHSYVTVHGVTNVTFYS